MIREAFVSAGILKPDALNGQPDSVATIVRELAERGPFTDGEYNQSCVFCAVVFNVNGGGMDAPANHEPNCLWRRAREMYPRPAATDETVWGEGEWGA